jgi:hypothetical protein
MATSTLLRFSQLVSWCNPLLHLTLLLHPLPPLVSPQLVSWYDNEWGYSNRVVDLAAFLHRKSLVKA